MGAATRQLIPSRLPSRNKDIAMNPTPASPTRQNHQDDPEDVMAAYGIECVPVEYFHWNGYRYSTLKDALAAAKRAPSGVGLAAAV